MVSSTTVVIIDLLRLFLTVGYASASSDFIRFVSTPIPYLIGLMGNIFPSSPTNPWEVIRPHDPFTIPLKLWSREYGLYGDNGNEIETTIMGYIGIM